MPREPAPACGHLGLGLHNDGLEIGSHGLPKGGQTTSGRFVVKPDAVSRHVDRFVSSENPPRWQKRGVLYTVTTIFPRACPSARYLKASGTWFRP
jgi:hypothetical protein